MREVVARMGGGFQFAAESGQAAEAQHPRRRDHGVGVVSDLGPVQHRQPKSLGEFAGQEVEQAIDPP